VRFGKQGQTAFSDEVDAAGRDRVLDHVQVVVEADSKIGIVPGYQGPFEPGQQEPEILAESLEVHGLIGHRGIDTKGAGVRAPQAAEHGNHLEEGRFPERRVDKLPTLAYPREGSGLLGSREVDARGPVLRAVPQDVTERTLIREAQHIVEVTRGVFGVTASVRPPITVIAPLPRKRLLRARSRGRGGGCGGRESYCIVQARLIAHQGETRRPDDSLVPALPSLSPRTQSALPPIELAFFQPPLPAELPDRHAAPCGFPNCGLPEPRFVHILFLPVHVGPPGSRPTHTHRAVIVTTREYGSGSQNAEDGFTGCLHIPQKHKEYKMFLSKNEGMAKIFLAGGKPPTDTHLSTRRKRSAKPADRAFRRSATESRGPTNRGALFYCLNRRHFMRVAFFPPGAVFASAKT
jgi:hypothetical protein